MNTRSIKIFRGSDVEKLENEIHLWLSRALPTLEVISIVQSESAGSVTITILFKPAD